MNDELYDLDTPLLALTSDEKGNPIDLYTARSAVAGTFCAGSTGAGKTSGSGNALARAFLRNGWGGLVLCCKSDEANNWRKLCALENRSEDIIGVLQKNPQK